MLKVSMAISRTRARARENLAYFDGSLVNEDFEKNILSGENKFADCFASHPLGVVRTTASYFYF